MLIVNVQILRIKRNNYLSKNKAQQWFAQDNKLKRNNDYYPRLKLNKGLTKTRLKSNNGLSKTKVRQRFVQEIESKSSLFTYKLVCNR